MKIINYLKYSRYRPANILETIKVITLNFLLIDKIKCVSFHIFRLKTPPKSSIYFNNFGRCIIYLLNTFSIIFFNKLLNKNISTSKGFPKKFTNGNDEISWPALHHIDYQKNFNNILEQEITERINKFYKHTLNKDYNDLSFWAENRKKFQKYYFDDSLNIIIEKLKNFRNPQVDFSARILKNESLENLNSRKNKFEALNLINLYHKLSELSDLKILSNSTDVNIGNPNYLNYRNQFLSERFLNQIYYISQIKNNIDLNLNNQNIFLEVGPGFGSLTKLLKNNYKKSKFILIDLPEINILSYFFLQTSFPDAKICLSNDLSDNQDLIDENYLKRYDILILDQNDLKKIKSNLIDCTINTRSLGEMSISDQDFYIENIEKVTKRYFYSVNRFKHDNVLFSSTNGYYEFKLSGEKWDKVLYKFSPTLHIETLLEKKIL